MRILTDRVWPQIKPALASAREVLVTTWNLKLDALVELANAAPKGHIRLIIDRSTAQPPFTGNEYKAFLDHLGDRVEIRANKGPRVLHAKVLIVRGPSGIAIVGSGNLTKPGLGCDALGNIEASVLVEQGPEFNNLLVWFEQLFSTMQAYVQPQDELILNAFRSAEVGQRILDEPRQDEQEVESDTSWEDTLSTTTGGIAGLSRRVIEGMNAPPSQLRIYQETILQTLEQNWARQDFRELIVLPVGAGKTEIAAAFIAQRLSDQSPPMRILWVAHTLQLVEQAASVVLSRLSVKAITVPVIFWVGGAKSKDEVKQLGRTDPCLAFATVQSLDSLRQELVGRSTFDLVVVDEAHHLGAQRWGTVIREACRRGSGGLLGLTATPKRLDEMELPFNEEIHDGGVTFRTLVEQNILAIPQYEAVQTEGDRITVSGTPRNEGEARRYFERNVGMFFDKPWRNRFIARDLARRKLGQTLVFCATKDHADCLAQELREAGLPQDQVRSVHSGCAVSDRAKALEWFRVRGVDTRLLLNCKLYIEGFDMTDFQTVVLARPTLSPTYWVQMIGRGVRRSQEHPIFDIIEYTDTYEEERWDALRASFYLLHDKGLEWWQELRERWPDSAEPELIKEWNRLTRKAYDKMAALSEINGAGTLPLSTAEVPKALELKGKRAAA